MSELEKALKHVSVIGAAGKMGSGIALLLLQLVSSEEGAFQLNLIDSNEAMLGSLKKYLRDQLTRYAERNINSLRKRYSSHAELIDNEEIVNHFVQESLDHVKFGSSLEDTKGSSLIFEAIIENVEAKTHLFETLDKINDRKPYYFTNTSSIPISVLADKSKVGSRLIGYHFYNPPAVQKLLEIVIPKNADTVLVSWADLLAKKLHKTVVCSHDVAGFIGNGYFIREIAFTLKKVDELSASMPLVEAIYLMNRVTQDFLVRPMGTFQLLDYVGIDVCLHIVRIMKTYISGLHLDESLLQKMAVDGKIGGQNSDGSQKDGFFHYEKNVPQDIYQLESKAYIPLSEIKESCEKKLGPLPAEYVHWKILSKAPEEQRLEKLASYFNHLNDRSVGGALTKEYLEESKKIASGLVRDGVAHSHKDVDLVLMNGFFHLYGPSWRSTP